MSENGNGNGGIELLDAPAPAPKAKPAKAEAEVKVSKAITIPELRLITYQLTIEGETPLIVHRFGNKAKQQIRDKQQKKATQAKQAKDPLECYEESLYRLPDGRFGFPSNGVKLAMVDTGTLAGVFKTQLRQLFFVNPPRDAIEDNPEQLCPIIGEPEMREDAVRLTGGSADLRYRGVFNHWSMDLSITFLDGHISLDQIVNLLKLAGKTIGIGEWRPQKDGNYGQFHPVMTLIMG